MNDAHVSRLRYRALPASFIEVIEGSPIEVETDAFHARLVDRQLVLEMRKHFGSESEARRSADPFVNGWSIASGLRRGRVEVTFQFEGSEIVDRSPPADGANHASVSLQAPAPQLRATLTSHPIQIAFPGASPTFSASPEVEVLWARHQAYIEGREPLTSVAYFCSTYVQALAGGGDSRASKKYKISRKVFERVGKFTGTRGDYLTARKVVNNQPPIPLSQDDLRWLEAAVRLMIWRVGSPPEPSDANIAVNEVVGFGALVP